RSDRIASDRSIAVRSGVSRFLLTRRQSFVSIFSFLRGPARSRENHRVRAVTAASCSRLRAWYREKLLRGYTPHMHENLPADVRSPAARDFRQNAARDRASPGSTPQA